MSRPCQTPDDFQCKPPRFRTERAGVITSTYEIRSPWDATGTFRYGELIVHEAGGDPLVALHEEGNQWEKK